MSADNWATCPRCLREATKARDKAIEAAAKSYGKLPADKWKEKSDKANRPLKIESHMREDYELGVDDTGGFLVVYYASCQDCQFEFHHRHEERVPLDKKGSAP